MELSGDRTVVFFMDLQSVYRILVVAEPLFKMGEKVEFHPAMTFEDLKKGVAALQGYG